LFNFHYADGAKMLTVGGIIYDEGQENLVASCGFDNLGFISHDEKFYRIDSPNLTYRELRHLDTLLPINSVDEFGIDWLPKKDLEKYAKLYRYFPTFTESDM
jgi:hypothetical protein